MWRLGWGQHRGNPSLKRLQQERVRQEVWRLGEIGSLPSVTPVTLPQAPCPLLSLPSSWQGSGSGAESTLLRVKAQDAASGS